MRTLRPSLCLAIAFTVCGRWVAADERVLEGDNTVLSGSTLVKAGVYTIADADEDGAVQIIGDDLTVDFQGAELVGSNGQLAPDAFAGRGIVVRGTNVTVKNVKVRGYQVGIYAGDSPGLTLSDCDVSGNYRQRLKSTPQREDPDDWLYGHENDANEWLRYGAGIYLFNCPKATVRDCRARNGQNGLCLVRCDDSVVIDNDLSFMSGWGLAMWRTSRCDVSNNKFDWCIRGYSHGVYSRGQDSAGILVYEQCNDNVFAYNSATHGGDGFFLYAGNETLQKTGTGGCNRNILYKNDFSHAAANGIEATFSDGNQFIDNRLDECDHGVWAGYSYNTLISGNQMSDCKNGISIEHGENNFITDNVFKSTKVGVNLWWDSDVDLLASVFGKARGECPSSGNRVWSNVFEECETAIRLENTADSSIRWNRMSGVKTGFLLSGKVRGYENRDNDTGGAGMTLTGGIELGALLRGSEGDSSTKNGITMPTVNIALPPDVRGSRNSVLAADHPRGRRFIIVDEWGPYDFSEVRIFPQRVLGSESVVVSVLGPKGTFRVINPTEGVKISPIEGTVSGTITVSALQPGVTRFAAQVEINGTKQEVRGSLVRAEWSVRFFAWDATNDPREKPEAWATLIQGAPLDERKIGAIDFVWWSGSPGEKVPADRFGTVATTKIPFPEGKWRLRTISDDGIRVWIDGQNVIDDWTWHSPKEITADVELKAGDHTIRVEHFEIDGHAQLQLFIEPM